MAGDRVLVTGTSGFTGGNLCRRLMREGHSVRALIRKPDRDGGLRTNGIETVLGDVRDPRSIKDAVEGIDTVFHIAALYRKENGSRKEMFETNAQGTRNLLDASIKAGVRRFMHCSTTGVHGDIKDPPANEESPFA